MSTPPPPILVAVDFSEPSGAAYRLAVEIAALADLRVHLLHVAEQRDWLEENRARVWLKTYDVSAEEVVTVPGTPWVQIVRCCETIKPLLLIVGRHGEHGYRPLATGSNTEHLLIRSPVPLLVVPMRPTAPARAQPIAQTSNPRENPHA